MSDAAPGHAEVRGLHDQRQAVGLGLVLDQVGQLHHGLFLDLRAAHDPVGQARVLGQADHVGVLVGHHADPDLADDGAQVVAAGAAHGDGADDHQLVEVLGVGKLGDRGRGRVAAVEHLVEVHLGHAAGGLAVLWSRSVSITRLSSTPCILPRPRRAALELAGLDELGDVVVGVETLAGRADALADLDRDGVPSSADAACKGWRGECGS
jgi:hypothetical protein